MPVEKNPGDKVFAGTLNGQGALDVEALQAASDTVLARIIKMVEEAQDSKAPTERFLETFEQYYATLIIVGVILFIIIPPALGWTDFTSNFYRAMVLMTVASPCALIISTPAAFISAIASAARSGVLFKGGAYLEALAGIKAITFDKTGTLTQGKPVVTDIVSCCELCEDDLLSTAAAVESRSEHPLARAIIDCRRRAQAGAAGCDRIRRRRRARHRGAGRSAGCACRQHQLFEPAKPDAGASRRAIRAAGGAGQDRDRRDARGAMCQLRRVRRSASSTPTGWA